MICLTDPTMRISYTFHLLELQVSQKKDEPIAPLFIGVF
jgi:hypothetical protein